MTRILPLPMKPRLQNQHFYSLNDFSLKLFLSCTPRTWYKVGNHSWGINPRNPKTGCLTSTPGKGSQKNLKSISNYFKRVQYTLLWLVAFLQLSSLTLFSQTLYRHLMTYWQYPEPSKRCSLVVEISQKNGSATISVLNDDNMPRKRNWLPVIKCLSFVPHEGDGQECGEYGTAGKKS